ncbi:MAG: HEPN domain-containing protein [Armatimonadota bacterium]
MALDADATRYADGITHLCQQCVEKYLKAVLTAHDETHERSHDLVALGTRASRYTAAISEMYEELKVLSPFAVAVRYPGKDATAEDVERAVQTMERARLVLREALGLTSAPDEVGTEDDEER